MPELPDVVAYLEALTRHTAGRRLTRVNLLSPFVLRSVDPPIDAIFGRTVLGVRRIGKRIVLSFDSSMGQAPPPSAPSEEDALFLIVHTVAITHPHM